MASVRRDLARSVRYESYRRHVEPLLLGRPRVHRLGAVPCVGDDHTEMESMAVCVDPTTPGDASRTSASIARQTVAPVQTLEMPLERALRETQAAWVAVVGAGTRLAPRALERLGQGATVCAGLRVVSCDDDSLDMAGRRTRPRLRPGPSPDLWLERDPDFALLGLAREPALAALARSGGDPYCLFLLLAGPDGAGHAHVPMILCHTKRSDRGGLRPDREAVKQLVEARDPGTHLQECGGGRWRVRRGHSREPAVEVIVCFRDCAQLLERCAHSLLDRSAYERVCLRLVDNGSSDSDMAALLERLGRDGRVTVEADRRSFNFSALNNAAASRSAADVLVFLNNDTEVVEPDWIEVLLEHAVRPEVGAVAPLLTYPEGRVQHAGVAVGLHGWAGHPFAGLAPDAQTPFGSATDGTRNWLAVTAACLMVERRKFHEVAGFDESFVVGGGDVDLGLRLTAAGYRSLCVPHTRLIHDESATRDPARMPPGDYEASRRSYGAFRTVGDPFYHPALTLQDTTCRLRRAGEPPVPD